MENIAFLDSLEIIFKNLFHLPCIILFIMNTVIFE